jgi:hypothetical protein
MKPWGVVGWITRSSEPGDVRRSVRTTVPSARNHVTRCAEASETHSVSPRKPRADTAWNSPGPFPSRPIVPAGVPDSSNTRTVRSIRVAR